MACSAKIKYLKFRRFTTSKVENEKFYTHGCELIKGKEKSMLKINRVVERQLPIKKK